MRGNGRPTGLHVDLCFYTSHLSAIETLITGLRRGAPERYEDLLASTGAARETLATVTQDLVDAATLVVTSPGAALGGSRTEIAAAAAR